MSRIIETLSQAKSLLENSNFPEADSLIRIEIVKYKELPELMEKYEELKSKCIKIFFEENFRKVKLSDEQFLAVADISQNLLLRARAGSGKTTTLSLKIVYLIQCEKIDQNKIVSLCFNSAATRNIIKKLRDDFDIKYREKENIATFHSLAGQISPAEKGVETLFDDRDPLSKQKLTAFVEEILKKKWDEPFEELRNEEIINSNGIFGFIKKFLVNVKYNTYKTIIYAIARADSRYDSDEEANELENKAILYGSKEYYLYRRNLSYITLDGKHVKSFGEKCIADYLFEHDIKYKYEPNFRMFSSGREYTYHPDFELYEHKIIIEHWGIDEFDKQKMVPKHWLKTWDDYIKEMKEKRDYWVKVHKDYRLLQTNITQLRGGREEFESTISDELKKYNILNEKLPLDKIMEKISHDLRSKFSEKVVQYIQKAKQDECTPEIMKHKIDGEHYSKYSKVNIFLCLANVIYTEYEKNKINNHKIDFYDYLSNAVEEITNKHGNCILRSGVNINEIEWLLIDEFQDFSPLFMALVKVIQKYNPKVKLFCVGDDWQAINSFAGSDVELFNEFEREFPVNSAVKDLTINWRSNHTIVNLGNRIMTNHGIESNADPKNREVGIIEHRNINEEHNHNIRRFNIKEVKAEFGIDTDIDVVLLRYLDHTVKIIDTYLKSLKDDKEFKVLILSRKSKVKQDTLKDFIKRIEVIFVRKYPDDKNKIKVLFDKQTDKKENEYQQVESKTAHQSKGLEANVVIVLEATNRCFPLIHPDSLLFEIFGDTLDKIEDEERRLFYVACTRAKSDLYLLYEEDFDKKKTLTEFYPYLE
ncbi:MAG: hypothetical protein A3E32_01575 [Candidatus Zambryskibacteria bacterium RIFCSPHIGHO2_12_FULL_38_37]|uniref:DNA 3'-5' helicase n=1 Tax=Candidatus Zambryskibacteria bacterium RIFCSPHIGHO2_12_FULL_38_37 TaxID=1802751 RepID=A0A1G2TLC3_9BACT|nr:MAG: hypothetical protein A3E32_01575 [Candidatus Zambryskibacteria bacterium RIFCSPHIGHO2_12_FULL_38_37]